VRAGNTKILPDHIRRHEHPRQARNSIVNMERCRWISNDITNQR
jgi:hypothetical protein